MLYSFMSLCSASLLAAAAYVVGSVPTGCSFDLKRGALAKQQKHSVPFPHGSMYPSSIYFGLKVVSI